MFPCLTLMVKWGGNGVRLPDCDGAESFCIEFVFVADNTYIPYQSMNSGVKSVMDMTNLSFTQLNHFS